LHISDAQLVELARQDLLRRGFDPDFSDQVRAQVADLEQDEGNGVVDAKPSGDFKDLRNLLWSSIDNDTSRDLDQIEVAESLPDGATRILIGIADVDSSVRQGTPIDRHAQSQGTSVYTGVRTFPMLPEQLSEGLTSLLEGVDRLSLVIEFVVDHAGGVQSSLAYAAKVRNRAQLTYSGVGPWLEGSGGAPSKVAASAELQAEIELQDDAAEKLRSAR